MLIYCHCLILFFIINAKYVNLEVECACDHGDHPHGDHQNVVT